MSTDSADIGSKAARHIDAIKEKLAANNRPGLDEIKNGTGSHGEILGRLLEDLAGFEIEDKDGQKKRPLASLSTRTGDDPAVAMLDAWATALDVLSFYQERYANEGYLRTARERRSLLELARAVGYELKPGVAASVQLNFTVEDAPGAPDSVNVPRGTKVTSIPGQNQLPKTFETSVDFVARSDWNELRPRLNQPQEIMAGTTSAYVKGTDYVLQPGDGVLLIGHEREQDPGSEHWDFRVLKKVEPDPARALTLITWEKELGHPHVAPAVSPRIFSFRKTASIFGAGAPEWDDLPYEERKKYVDYNINSKTAVLFADETRFVSGGGDKRIHLWNIDTGDRIRSFDGHEKTVNELAVSPDGTNIASASSDRTLRFWDVDSGNEIASLDRQAGQTRAVVYSQDGTRLADGGVDQVIYITNAANQQAEVQLSGHTGSINALQFHPTDANRIVSGSTDKSLRVWDIGTGATITEIDAHATMVTCLDVSSDGNFILSGSSDETIKLHRISGEHELTIDLAGTQARDVIFLEEVAPVDGRPLAFAALCKDDSVRFWRGSIDQGQILWDISGFPATVGIAETLSRLSNGYVLVAGSQKVLLQTAQGDEVREFIPPPPDDLPDEWPDFQVGVGGRIDLDREYPQVVPDSWMVLRQGVMAEVYRVVENLSVQREDYLLNARVSQIEVDTQEHLDWFRPRSTQAFIESREIEIAEFPLPRKTPVQGDTIQLDRLVSGLETGKVMIVSGKRSRLRVRESDEHGPIQLQLKSSDQTRQYELIPGELLLLLETPRPDPDPEDPDNPADFMIWELESKTGFIGFVSIRVDRTAFDWLPAEADDETRSEAAIVKNAYPDPARTFTIIQFAAALRHTFDPLTFTLHANIIPATHGETSDEVLGSGDGSIANQTFVLRKPPLTHVSAPTLTGSKSTLEVRVNDLLWEEAPSLYNLGPNDTKYIARRQPDGSTRVIFGDGIRGARLPTGQENVSVRYRTGIGPEGEVGAGSLRLLQIRPLGIREVTNPLAAAGSGGPEDRDTARARTPMAVRALGRMVSLKDYEGFIRVFAGIGKTHAAGFQRGEEQIVHVTIAGENGGPIDPASELYRNLLNAVEQSKTPFQIVEIDNFRLHHFNVAARLRVDPAYDTEEVFAAAEANLRDRFSFQARAFAQDATSADVITALQKTAGVEAVDLDQLYLDGTQIELDILYQSHLENTTLLGPEVRAELNRLISGDPALPYSERALVIEEKPEQRWLVREAEPDWQDAHVIVKDAGKLRVYVFTRTVRSFLPALDARLIDDRIDPAELLLLNPVNAGVILMEFEA